jgi:hypothetical protein
MIPRSSSWCRVAALAGWLLAAGCSEVHEPILVDGGVITIENTTDKEWKNIKLVLNDHFFGGAPALAPGQRLNAMVSSLQTGFGQRFDRSRMPIKKIEVTATDADGQPVNLKWGTERPAQ